MNGVAAADTELAHLHYTLPERGEPVPFEIYYAALLRIGLFKCAIVQVLSLLLLFRSV
ncbi:hypothetical protein Trydic_g21037, partial [Trypoxylus dichotomus]